MTNPDPIEPIVRLGQRLAEIADSLGLHLNTFGVLPNFEGGPHVAQAVFTVSPKALDASPEPDAAQAAIDEQFQRMVAEQKLLELDEKAEAARQRLIEMLEEREG